MGKSKIPPGSTHRASVIPFSSIVWIVAATAIFVAFRDNFRVLPSLPLLGVVAVAAAVNVVAGVFAVVVTALTLLYFILPPHDSFRVQSLDTAGQLLLYVVFAVFMVIIVSGIRRRTAHIRKLRRDADLALIAAIRNAADLEDSVALCRAVIRELAGGGGPPVATLARALRDYFRADAFALWTNEAGAWRIGDSAGLPPEAHKAGASGLPGAGPDLPQSGAAAPPAWTAFFEGGGFIRSLSWTVSDAPRVELALYFRHTDLAPIGPKLEAGIAALARQERASGASFPQR